MALPNYSYTETSGIRFTKGAGDRFLFIGCCSVPTANEVVDIPRTANIRSVLGYGPLAEVLGLANTMPGQHGPHYAIRATGGVAAAWGSITKVGGHAGPTITFTGSVPYDRYQWRWRTLTTGILGAGQGQYSLDNGFTWSPLLTIPSGGTYAMPGTNTTLTFPSGTYTAGQEYTASSTEPYFTTTNLGTAITAAIADTTIDFDAVVLVGAPADATAGAAMYSAFATQLATLTNYRRYCGGILDIGGGDTTSNVSTEMASLSNARILPWYADGRVQIANGFVGYSRPMISGSIIVGARSAASLVSESLGRVASGQLAGVSHVSYDEEITGALNDDRIATFRSFSGGNPPGYYVSYDHVKGPVGSDIIIWPMRRVADRSAKIVASIMLTKILENFPTNDDGTLLDTAAAALESELNSALTAELKEKKDRSGKNGHVSDIYAQVDRENIYATDRTINVTTLIRANQPAEQITNTQSFTAGSVTGEASEEPPEEPED